MEATMPIRFASFSPELLQALTRAYELACTELRLDPRGDPVNEMVADKVLKWGQVETDPVRICEKVVAEIKEL
jgi:hypothetical protein